jgi:hypothetical protein
LYISSPGLIGLIEPKAAESVKGEQHAWLRDLPQVFINVWERKLDNVSSLSSFACSVFGQFLEKQPLVEAEREDA